MIITAGVMLMIFVLFSFFNSSIEEAGSMKEVSFYTPTPGVSILEDGWWAFMPTPIHVAPDPQRNSERP
jgi:hypothetical protein